MPKEIKKEFRICRSYLARYLWTVEALDEESAIKMLDKKEPLLESPFWIGPIHFAGKNPQELKDAVWEVPKNET